MGGILSPGLGRYRPETTNAVGTYFLQAYTDISLIALWAPNGAKSTLNNYAHLAQNLTIWASLTMNYSENGFQCASNLHAPGGVETLVWCDGATTPVQVGV